jgi:hypothetical protein
MKVREVSVLDFLHFTDLSPLVASRHFHARPFRCAVWPYVLLSRALAAPTPNQKAFVQISLAPVYLQLSSSLSVSELEFDGRTPSHLRLRIWEDFIVIVQPKAVKSLEEQYSILTSATSARRHVTDQPTLLFGNATYPRHTTGQTKYDKDKCYDLNIEHQVTV